MTLPIHACSFVLATDLFRHCARAWAVFTNSDTDCSFGNNNRTMVTRSDIEAAFDDADLDPEEEAQVNVVRERLAALPDDRYIDLEN